MDSVCTVQVELYEHSTLSSDFDEEYSEPLNRAVRSHQPFAQLRYQTPNVRREEMPSRLCFGCTVVS